MALVQSVKVGALVLPVRVLDEIPVDGGGNASGQWLYETGELQVSRSRNPSEAEQREVVLHEALHVIDEALGIGLRERQITALGHALHALLVDNPGLMETT
jgi:hypothetical protein